MRVLRPLLPGRRDLGRRRCEGVEFSRRKVRDALPRGGLLWRWRVLSCHRVVHGVARAACWRNAQSRALAKGRHIGWRQRAVGRGGPPWRLCRTWLGRYGCGRREHVGEDVEVAAHDRSSRRRCAGLNVQEEITDPQGSIGRRRRPLVFGDGLGKLHVVQLKGRRDFFVRLEEALQ